MKKLLFVANFDAFFISHRLPIAIEASKKGYDVFVLCEDTGRTTEILKNGFNFIPLPVRRDKKANIFSELKYIIFLWRKFKEINPDIIHHISIKPVLYGSLVSKFRSSRVLKINAFSGMGFLFTGNRKRIAEKVFPPILKYIFCQKRLNIILQNHDDFNYFFERGIVKKSQLFLIKGSGVDLNAFSFHPIPEVKDKNLRFIFPARMLKDKGVWEFYEAAKIIKQTYPKAEFNLCGDIDIANPSSLSLEQLNIWNTEGIVSWKGYENDIKKALANHHVVVLPSYREGLPKSLIEACAVGRPIITTDTNGCRECVESGKNGYLIPVNNSKELASAMEKLIENHEKLTDYGEYSRSIAEREFNVDCVVDKTLDIYRIE